MDQTQTAISDIITAGERLLPGFDRYKCNGADNVEVACLDRDESLSGPGRDVFVDAANLCIITRLGHAIYVSTQKTREAFLVELDACNKFYAQQ
ncbi:MAG: hypothetical protein ACYCS8_01985 [Acidithiobacillus sp.]